VGLLGSKGAGASLTFLMLGYCGVQQRHYLTPTIPLLCCCRFVSICSVAGFPQRPCFDLVNLTNVFTRQINTFVASPIAAQDYHLSLAADSLLSCLRCRELMR